MVNKMTIPDWADVVLNAVSVKAIFGSDLPALDGVSIHEIVLHRDGPRVLLRFDLKAFPARPPAKWVAAGFNRVQVRLLAVGVHGLQITGLQSNIHVDIQISMEGSMIRMHGDNGTFRFDVVTESVIVDGISAYRDDEPVTGC